MSLTIEDVRRLALMTRLEMSEEEQERLRGELGAILRYVDRLAGVDTRGVPEMEPRVSRAQSDQTLPESIEQQDWLRRDEVLARDERTRSLILENFPEAVADALKVPAVFEKPKGAVK